MTAHRGGAAGRDSESIGPILFPFLGSEIGGSHVATFELGKALMSDFGLRCVVVAAEGSLIGAEAAREGFEVEATKERTVMRHNPLYDLRMLPRRIRKLARYGQNAIVHCNDIGALQSWSLPAKALRLKAVYHHHALNRMVLPNRLIVGLADATICVSRPCRESVAFLSDRVATTILNPFGIEPPADLQSRKQQLRAEARASSNAPLIGFIGNFWHRKRPHFFLDTCKVIATQRPEARFFVFGRNGEITQSELEEHAHRLGIRDLTVFAGFRLPAVNNIAPLDMLLMPAIREPFGRTLVEALMLGVPYVAAADAGHREISERWAGGRLLPVSSTPEDYAREVLETLDQKDRVILTPERRMEIARELSPRSQAERVLAVYKAL
jgi:glycosyltransferase involved in cell wall biosynthesis